MKFSITLSAIAVAFIGAVAAAPTAGTYASCNSNPAYKDLNIPSGYAVITAYDNNAANVSGRPLRLAVVVALISNFISRSRSPAFSPESALLTVLRSVQPAAKGEYPDRYC